MGGFRTRIKAKFLRRNSAVPSLENKTSAASDSRSLRPDDHEQEASRSSSHLHRPRSLATTPGAASSHQSIITRESHNNNKQEISSDKNNDPNSNGDGPNSARSIASPTSNNERVNRLSTTTSALSSSTLSFNDETQESVVPPSNEIAATSGATSPTVSMSGIKAANSGGSNLVSGRAETLLASSNLHSTVLGSDLQNSSTTPMIITPLPSINETTSTALNERNEDLLAPEAETPTSIATGPAATRPGVPRRQSLLPNRQTALIRSLLHSGQAQDLSIADPDQYLPIENMVTRKIWVKRPGASATLITINEDDLVDDVRDMILRKYANSLGRTFDAPDLTLRVCPRDQNHRLLQPDETMGRTLDAYFPNGQTVDDALLIDIPVRRTPKASPNPRFYADDRPHESGSDYFPPYPPVHSNHSHAAPSAAVATGPHNNFPPAMTIMSNGGLPLLPSPGGTRRLGGTRPKIQRMQTASPSSTATNGHVPHVQHAPVSGMTGSGTHVYSTRPPRSRTHSAASSDQSAHPSHAHQAPVAPPMPTPPIPERSEETPPPRVSSPRPSDRPKKMKKNIAPTPSLPPGMLNGGVPPINVLIVEDNIINLKLLEAFVKRLKVRWQTAMDGRQAVNKWRAGGFHLVLMDIQLPVMNGLEATREIRRIEKVNSIGVFSSGAITSPDEVKPEPVEGDKLSNTEMFKSPVIIVALTASSLQSDRHEALAAGCNDFLTKPVNFVWLERKVMEWGCMQALIDFDGWRKWKDFSKKAAEDETAKKTKANKKNRLSMQTAVAA